MIPLIGGCILIGCLQDVPIVVGNGGWRPELNIGEQFRKDNESPPACYVEGVFYSSCPKKSYTKAPIRVKQ